MHVLVTGGAGYIGSHTIVELLDAGHSVTAVDSLRNSSAEALKRVEQITRKSVAFHTFDLCDKTKLDKLFAGNTFDAVIHFAGLKAVDESIKKPLLYYRTNIDSTLTLLESMQKYAVNRLVFSSSATVYGVPSELPVRESSTVGIGITNAYGRTKYFIEEILRDCAKANSQLSITILRYFNPVGAHESGLIGEDSKGTPNNLMPFIAQTAAKMHDKLHIYGNDYDTVDGTGVRDYIHVVDLARGHLAALEHLHNGVTTYNLGTGDGVSVLELIAAFSKAAGKKIPYDFAPRRPGDVAVCFASADKANKELRWGATKTIADACVDTWRWQCQNPHGYAKAKIRNNTPTD